MKTTLIIFSLIIVSLIILLFTLGFISKSGKAPGIIAGSLSKCPNSPNCVCSEHPRDTAHFIEPIDITQNITIDTLSRIKITIQALGGTIETDRDNYLAATFSSAIFGFIDDVEIRIDSMANVIHIRSASRVGRGDAGVNKKRTELIRNLLEKH